MNANTRVRLWKEGIALLPFWVAMAGMMAVPFILPGQDPIGLAFSAYIFACALLGSVSLGQEFQHRSLGLLLSQPVSRRRLWWEKMVVLSVALLGLLLWLVVLGLIELEFVREPFAHSLADQAGRAEEMRQLREHFSSGEGLLGLTVLLMPMLLGIGSGPALTLLARSTIGGVALTFLCPWGLFFIGFLVLEIGFDSPVGWNSHSSLLIPVFGCYAGMLFLLGCRRFQRWEDAHGHMMELALPPWFAKSFALTFEWLTWRNGSAWGRLFRKEVRLQLPTFVVAGMLIALWLLLMAGVIARPAVEKELLLLPVVLLCIGIPAIAGILSTAEERSLGLVDWHLTLPVAAHRQWLIKTLVATGVNLGFGVLLPAAMTCGAAWVLDVERQPKAASDVTAFLIANAVIFCAGLYASTASPTSMRALVGTTVLFIGGAMVLNFADHIAATYPDAVYFNAHYGREPSASIGGRLYQYRWLIGWSYLAACLYLLGLENFRRSLESLRQPVRQMAWFFALVFLFVSWAIDW